METSHNGNGHGTFPPQFLWGAAMAAYQVEGAASEDGRGVSIWDRFCSGAGNVRNGESGAVACDFYHRYREDVALMRDLGLTALRFSVSWPRVLPEGRGRVNAPGLDFYDRLVDELLAREIEPVVTLYHWDLPQTLEDEGGWPRRATVDAFCEFTTAVATRLGDRVTRWITQNEPWVVAWLGYGDGVHAPGRRSIADALATGHHVLLSHGLGTGELRRHCPGAQVGIAIDVNDVRPASLAPEDVAAAREHDGERNRWFLDPVFRGSYPADVVERFEHQMPHIADGDMACIATPIDFLGLNYYRREVVARTGDGGYRIVRQEEVAHTDMDWEIWPDGLTDVLVRMRDDYAPPSIHITENGAAFEDVCDHDGQVRDPERQAYLAAHLDAVARAIEHGVPVDGYFAWSLLDNFEWARGYSKRFGLVYLDYPTLDRIPKSSFSWYRAFIAEARATPAR